MTSATLLHPSGALPEEIQLHYDVSNDFYELWLDEMVYSSGFWQKSDTLALSQKRKHQFHCKAIDAQPAHRVLDVGCGWGAFMHTLSKDYSVTDVSGITLSAAQLSWISERYPHLWVKMETWENHAPTAPYDSIVAIESLDHFVRPTASKEEKIETFQNFFSKCASWLVDYGRLSLQVITYNQNINEEKRKFLSEKSCAVFPGSELPFPDEILTSSKNKFLLLESKDWSNHYAKSCNAWRKNLHAKKSIIIEKFGLEQYNFYQQYLRMAEFGFTNGNSELHTFVFQKL